MVERRTLAEIRVMDREIRGIANPALEGSPRGRGAVQFRIVLGLPRGRTRLYFGPPSHDPDDCQRPVCLGPGEGALLRLEMEGDLYGMVDFVLGFMATNRVGALPPAPVEELQAPREDMEGPRDAA